ncbi:unnamed protein product [Mytilus coruscus]|uniref:Uncharacterized protein n=1 Tax=Mytilus coruscus TaxID=42192 RepID=A0A6J8DCA4_MYTCO|nr:unnamed protein product [Mytilus coruscus]
MQPKLLASMPPKKSNRSKSEKSRTLMSTNSRTMFDPINTENGEILTSFAIAMRGILPNACIFRGLPKEDINEHNTEADEEITEDHKETEDPTGPETVHQSPDMLCISNYTLHYITCEFNSQTSCYDFLNFLLKLLDDEVFFIEKSTVGQHDNCNWFSLRKGRITASKFYQIFTMVNSVKSKSSVDCNSLIKIVMGYTSVNPNIKALKHGRETEPIAYFFINCILPELLFPKLDSVEQLPESMEVETSVCTTQTYFCPTCNNVIKESELQ